MAREEEGGLVFLELEEGLKREVGGGEVVILVIDLVDLE